MLSAPAVPVKVSIVLLVILSLSDLPLSEEDAKTLILKKWN